MESGLIPSLSHDETDVKEMSGREKTMRREQKAHIVKIREERENAAEEILLPH